MPLLFMIFLSPYYYWEKQAEYDKHILSLLELNSADRVLDLGCGTGVLTRMIADRLDSKSGGVSVGIDAAAKMILVAGKKRGSGNCRFEVMAAEDLSFEDQSFDVVVSSLFFHHIPLDLKEKTLAESFRILRPGGRLIIADMHIPTTWMGALVSHVSRWFFMQPQIGENIRGVLPSVIERSGIFCAGNCCHLLWLHRYFLKQQTGQMRQMDHTYDKATHNLRIEDLQDVKPFDALQHELSAGLAMYWSIAGHILESSGITLLDPAENFFSITNNFFSTLFLYSYHRTAIPEDRRIIYVAVNHCLRGMVTGCDNLLDDEYKKTLETDLPENGYRFRSILDIMVSDRILFQILMESMQTHSLTLEQVLSASAASLQSLGKSGAQEASEENGIPEDSVNRLMY